MVLGLRGALTGETEVLVDGELAADRVAASADGETDDNEKGPQLSGDLLDPSTEAGVSGLGRLHHATRRSEHAEGKGGLHFELVWRGDLSKIVRS